MSIEDRDYYRNDVHRKSANRRPPASQNDSLLHQVISETDKRKHGRRPLIALAWIAAVAVLYLIFSVTTKHT